jgi:hypothetical protein
MQWFRMYAEFISDPLIRMLSFDDQRHFVATLCLKASGALDKAYPSPEIRRAVIAQLIGLNADEIGGTNALDAANARLRKLGLVNEEWQPTNWAKRQFQSDHADRTAAERMRRYRSKRNVTDVTPDVTALDTDTDTDTEKKKAKSKSAPKRATRVPQEFSPDLDYARAQCPDIDADREAQKFRDWEFAKPRSDWAACWRTWIGNCLDSGKYARAPKGGMTFGGKPVEWQ